MTGATWDVQSKRVGGILLSRNADGSLTIFVQHAKPRVARARANWLPAPAGSFHLLMRLYLSKRSALDGTYRIPPFLPVG